VVTPDQVPRILGDAARLVGDGEIVVFGSGSLAYSLKDAPSSRDLDICVLPPEKGGPIEGLMGELSWYHERHGVYVEVWGPETFAAPSDWRQRSTTLKLPEWPGVAIVIPHPHDVLVSKLERSEAGDLDHIRRILAEHPLTGARLCELADRTPYRRGTVADARRRAAFEAGVQRLGKTLPAA
jgi:hypothetical protein